MIFRTLLVIAVLALTGCQKRVEAASNTSSYSIIKQCTKGNWLVEYEGTQYLLDSGQFTPVASGAAIQDVCP